MKSGACDAVAYKRARLTQAEPTRAETQLANRHSDRLSSVMARSKMIGVSRVMLLLVFSAVVQLTVGQVTFSKGWGPGKRSVADSECRVNAKALTLLLHVFSAELRRLVTCDHQEAVGYLQTVLEH